MKNLALSFNLAKLLKSQPPAGALRLKERSRLCLIRLAQLSVSQCLRERPGFLHSRRKRGSRKRKNFPQLFGWLPRLDNHYVFFIQKDEIPLEKWTGSWPQNCFGFV